MVMDYLILAIKLLSGDQFSNLSGLVATNSDLNARIFPALQQSSFSQNFTIRGHVLRVTFNISARLVTSYFI